MPRDRDKWNNYMREYRKSPRMSDYVRNNRYKSQYGITLEQYDAMLEAQNNGCAICGVSPEQNGRRLDIDHCHTSGKVRGLLCTNCNTGIGKFNDDPDLLAEAMKYLYRNH